LLQHELSRFACKVEEALVEPLESYFEAEHIDVERA